MKTTQGKDIDKWIVIILGVLFSFNFLNYGSNSQV